MIISWQERLLRAPNLRALNTWPALPLDCLPASQRRAFMRNQAIVARVLAGERYRDLSAATGLSPGRISTLMRRCLGGDDQHPPALLGGLVPHVRLNPYRRRQTLATLDQPASSTGSFGALLATVPGLQAGLDSMIDAALRESPAAQRLTPAAVHGEFRRLLQAAGHPRDCYPYTTASVAYSSVRRYYHAYCREWYLARDRREAARRPRHFARDPTTRAGLRAIQIDEHLLDLHGRVDLWLDGDYCPLRLARASVLVAIDVDTQLILAYWLTPTAAPNQDDILGLFERCVLPWQPPELTTPGLAYTPGAGFPSALAFPVSFGTVHMDNAWLHRAHSVESLLCQKLGVTINRGLPASPKARALVESVFKYLNAHFSHRAASTTGTHPHDPNREARRHRQRPPHLLYHMIDEALAVVLSDANVRPRDALGGATPLHAYQEDIAHRYVRYVPAIVTRQFAPFLATSVHTIRHYAKQHRRPYIQFTGRRYYGEALLHVRPKDARVRVQFDRRDIRELQAMTLDGQALGTLTVEGAWARYPHSLATRKLVNRYVKHHRLREDDPLAGMFHWLLAHKSKPKHAQTLLRVYTEFTRGSGGALALPSDPAGSPVVQPADNTEPYAWSADRANHRR